jgi:hypothetical protein
MYNMLWSQSPTQAHHLDPPAPTSQGEAALACKDIAHLVEGHGKVACHTGGFVYHALWSLSPLAKSDQNSIANVVFAYLSEGHVKLVSQ